jgi:hypothetical protein
MSLRVRRDIAESRGWGGDGRECGERGGGVETDGGGERGRREEDVAEKNASAAAF